MVSECLVCGATTLNASFSLQDCHVCRKWSLSLQFPKQYEHLVKMAIIAPVSYDFGVCHD